MLKKLIAPVVVSGALLGSLAVGGAAYAGTPASTPATTAPVTAPAGLGHHGNGKVRAWMRANRAANRAEVLAVSAQTIGITPQELKTELKAGASIAQVATAHGVSVTAVVGALTTAADAKVTAARTAGSLTQAQADRITARIPARITRIVNHVF